jgi:Zn-dependent protease
MAIETFFSIAILIMSVVIHEVSHGFAARFLGDPTAELAGRLTLNPLKHLDPIGSVLVPLITSFSGFTFGWAKPVPYNPYNLRPGRWSELIVAAAGPAANLCLVMIFGLLVRSNLIGDFFGAAGTAFVISVIAVNLVLAIFNLMPIPPLDGSKILFAFLPFSMAVRLRNMIEPYGFIAIIIFVFFFWQFLLPIVFWLFKLIVGQI